MSSGFRFSPLHADSEDGWSTNSTTLAKRLLDIGTLFRRIRVQMRIGDLTRVPLRLLRFQVKENVAECDWLARPADPWDADLRAEIGQRHASLQALRDAVDVRSLLFEVLPDVDAAFLRIYRETSVHERELIISGYVHRIAPSFRSMHSMTMRAKLLGFRFSLQNDILRTMKEATNMELVDW